MLMVYWALLMGSKVCGFHGCGPCSIKFPDGLSVGVAPPEQCADGRRMDKDPFRAGAGATLSHTIVIVFALLSVLGFLSYGFIGIGKFMEIFFRGR